MAMRYIKYETPYKCDCKGVNIDDYYVIKFISFMANHLQNEKYIHFDCPKCDNKMIMGYLFHLTQAAHTKYFVMYFKILTKRIVKWNEKFMSKLFYYVDAHYKFIGELYDKTRTFRVMMRLAIAYNIKFTFDPITSQSKKTDYNLLKRCLKMGLIKPYNYITLQLYMS